jgi:spore maturation protein CgeB
MGSIKKMIIIGSFTGGAIENIYKRGVEKCGVLVDIYASADQYFPVVGRNTVNRILNKLSPDIFFKGINKRLLDFMAGRKYDTILVFKGMELYEATIRQLKKHTDLLVNYNCDHPFIFYSPGAGNSNVLNSIKEYDVHISYSRKITEQLKNDFNKQAFCIPFGYDSDITGSGTGVTKLYADRFLFIGAHDRQRTAFLEELYYPDLDIYGDAKWKTRNLSKPYILQAYKQRSLYGSDYTDAVAASSGIINLLRDQNIREDSHNMRTFEVPGYGGLLISQRTTEQLSFFEEDKEAVYFDNIDELRDKMKFLQQNPAVAAGIKKAGYEKSRRCKYDYNERSRQLLAHLTAYLN